MRGAVHPLPQYAFIAWCLVKHRENFTFTFLPGVQKKVDHVRDNRKRGRIDSFQDAISTEAFPLSAEKYIMRCISAQRVQSLFCGPNCVVSLFPG
jgi:hypothetical protein